ncbi:hypothetical protein K435DRAFT_871174 [Dendrothele bispora CBS 962.96]|uniref:Fork-head domain-containing protein n=1 Tax=Dendrothele bispora (strain CBS 962.96) TaxID=1314807 RepID=A0A4S8L4R2_DENBC|nr:hypothetical protein K435DRAFT_871174 [Dendrothele bispora CBS 962.96]
MTQSPQSGDGIQENFSSDGTTKAPPCSYHRSDEEDGPGERHYGGSSQTQHHRRPNHGADTGSEPERYQHPTTTTMGEGYPQTRSSILAPIPRKPMNPAHHQASLEYQDSSTPPPTTGSLHPSHSGRLRPPNIEGLLTTPSTSPNPDSSSEHHQSSRVGEEDDAEGRSLRRYYNLGPGPLSLDALPDPAPEIADGRHERSVILGSLRHTLSLQGMFRRIAKPVSVPGRGAYWALAIDRLGEMKRERKRGRNPSASANSREELNEVMPPPSDSEDLGNISSSSSSSGSSQASSRPLSRNIRSYRRLRTYPFSGVVGSNRKLVSPASICRSIHKIKGVPSPSTDNSSLYFGGPGHRLAGTSPPSRSLSPSPPYYIPLPPPGLTRDYKNPRIAPLRPPFPGHDQLRRSESSPGLNTSLYHFPDESEYTRELSPQTSHNMPRRTESPWQPADGSSGRREGYPLESIYPSHRPLSAPLRPPGPPSNPDATVDGSQRGVNPRDVMSNSVYSDSGKEFSQASGGKGKGWEQNIF